YEHDRDTRRLSDEEVRLVETYPHPCPAAARPFETAEVCCQAAETCLMISPMIGLKAFLFTLLWAAMASAMLLESDSYRYAAIALVCFSLVWCRPHLRLVARDWLAILCWLWAAYVLIRFIVGVAVYDERGTSEWL